MSTCSGAWPGLHCPHPAPRHVQVVTSPQVPNQLNRHHPKNYLKHTHICNHLNNSTQHQACTPCFLASASLQLCVATTICLATSLPRHYPVHTATNPSCSCPRCGVAGTTRLWTACCPSRPPCATPVRSHHPQQKQQQQRLTCTLGDSKK